MTGSSDKTKDLSVTALKGVGPKTAEVLERLNIRTLDDLEMNWPRSYEYYERPVRICDCPDEGLVSVSGVITGKPWRGGSGRRTMVSVFIDDGSGRMRLIWFNNPWIISNLKPGTRCVFRGRVYMNGRVKSLTQPVMFSPEDYEQFSGGLLPVYALTSGITNRQMRRLTAQALDSGYAADDFIPQRIMDRYGLRGTSGALRSMHFPKDAEDLAEARKRFVFEEFFLFILGLRSLRSDDAEGSGRGSDGIVLPGSPDTGALIDSLPYTLTDSQETAWSEISEDLASGSRMDRLLQGDVGSGKTVVAALAIVQAAASGKQAVLLAPTTILAEQHYATLTGMFQAADLDIPAVLLTGSMSAKEKAAAKQAISSGEAKAVIGTHALIQEDVAFADLALAVTDEQHRFGVLQRASLSFKAAVTPHILMMSATPIPRTQAILLFGSRAVSVLEEKPSGRLPVKNTVVDTAYRERAFNFIAKQIGGENLYPYLFEPMSAVLKEQGENVVVTVRDRSVGLVNVA